MNKKVLSFIISSAFVASIIGSSNVCAEGNNSNGSVASGQLSTSVNAADETNRYSFDEILNTNADDFLSDNSPIRYYDELFSTWSETTISQIYAEANSLAKTKNGVEFYEGILEVDYLISDSVTNDVLKGLYEMREYEDVHGDIRTELVISKKKIAELLSVPESLIYDAVPYDDYSGKTKEEASGPIVNGKKYTNFIVRFDLNKHDEDITDKAISAILFCTDRRLKPAIAGIIYNYRGKDSSDNKTDTADTSLLLTALTDEEFAALYDYSDYRFGDDSVPDDEKFRSYLDKVPAGYIGENYDSSRYHMLKRFADGEFSPYITIYVDRYTALYDTLTAEAFGYPEEWKMTAYDGVFEIDMGVPHQLHEYRIEVPLAYITDFEKYIRLERSFSIAGDSGIFERNPYGAIGCGDIFKQFNLYGDAVSNLYGDADCDYKVMMNDAVLIMQAISNPDRFGENGSDAAHITEQGKINADMDGGGLSANDALAIQKQLLFNCS